MIPAKLHANQKTNYSRTKRLLFQQFIDIFNRGKF